MIFDPVRHEYRDGDTLIPSVTQILAASGLINDRWYSEESRELGSAVHTLCERYANGERFDDTGRELEGLEYVNAFSAWMRDTRAYAIMTECIIDHVLNGHRYAGKFDLLAEIGGKRVLIDLKTGAKAKWHHAQIAAYSLAMNPDRGAVLYLRAGGTYKEDRLTGTEMVVGIEKFKECL